MGNRLCPGLTGTAPTSTLTVASPRLWDLDTPRLYTARVASYPPGTKAQRRCPVSRPFGFRTFETAGRRLPPQRSPPLSAGRARPGLLSRSDRHAALPGLHRRSVPPRPRPWGSNCVCASISKCRTPATFAAADKVGLLIWAELPDWSAPDRPSPHARARRTLAGMVRRDGNHPSIVIWTIINEDWGTELATNPDHRSWLRGMVSRRPGLGPHPPGRGQLPASPTTMWTATSTTSTSTRPCPTTPPNGRHGWTTWLGGGTSSLSSLTHQPDPQAEQKPPLIVSEFGNWGLPDLAPLLEHYDGDPWWFETGWDWSDGDVHPQGVMDRFRAMRLDKTFGTFAELARISQMAQVEAFKYEIESMRSRPSWADTSSPNGRHPLGVQRSAGHGAHPEADCRQVGRL